MGFGAIEAGLRQTCSGIVRAFTPGRLPAPQFKHLQRFPVRFPVRMVEGPQCHRVANVHRKVLKGYAFKAISPNQRFTEGAKLINGKVLARIEVHGKNLFYFFGEGAEQVVMHIHFGMSGRFRVSPLPGPETTPTTRLQLINDSQGIVANLSAMTVQHGDLGFYESQSGKIGPDPLREDADIEVVWQKLLKSKKPVGLVLMDQSMVAGIGNIYRAEILFKAGVHPEQPGNTVDREAFERIWRHSVLLLQRGFKEGSILTVDPAEAKILGPPWTRRYVYNHPHCGRCKTPVGVWDMAARTVYACPTCQPLVTGTELTAARSQALGKATPHKKFKSTCAPDGPIMPVPEAKKAPPEAQPPPQDKPLTVAELKSKLKSLGEATGGRKEELIVRLAEATAKETSKEEKIVAVSPQEAIAVAVEGVEVEEMAENARKEGATLKGGSKGKRRSRRAAKPSVKQEAADPPVEPVRKRKKMASKAKEETAIRPTSGAPEASGAEVAVKKEQASGKSGKGKGKKRGRSKAFDSVLEKEDIEGPIVVTSAGNDDTHPAPGLPEQDQWEGLTIPLLKHELQKRGLPVSGTKRTLVTRIREAPAVEQKEGAGVKPGITGIDAVATKEEAEEEKKNAGEGKNVEHVAL